MQQDIEDAAARCTFFERSLTTLQSESESLLVQDAAPAMDTLLVLVDRIEALHRVTQDQTTSALTAYRDPTSAFGAMQARAPLVNACRSQSRVVFTHFQSLSEKARDLTQRFTEVRQTAFLSMHPLLTRQNVLFVTNTACDGPYVRNLLGTRTLPETPEHSESCRDVAKWCRKSARKLEVRATSSHTHTNRVLSIDSLSGQKATAETHIQQARATIRSAQSKRDSAESARVRFPVFQRPQT